MVNKRVWAFANTFLRSLSLSWGTGVQSFHYVALGQPCDLLCVNLRWNYKEVWHLTEVKSASRKYHIFELWIRSFWSHVHCGTFSAVLWSPLDLNWMNERLNGWRNKLPISNLGIGSRITILRTRGAHRRLLDRLFPKCRLKAYCVPRTVLDTECNRGQE